MEAFPAERRCAIKRGEQAGHVREKVRRGAHRRYASNDAGAPALHHSPAVFF